MQSIATADSVKSDVISSVTQSISSTQLDTAIDQSPSSEPSDPIRFDGSTDLPPSFQATFDTSPRIPSSEPVADQTQLATSTTVDHSISADTNVPTRILESAAPVTFPSQIRELSTEVLVT